ncbi:MAG: DUF3291 domain-containing protein [Alphaproteobacteria bacterium]|nr:DUF3291 domain-containing protein [Alphaproteobacteria bacterium]
MTRTYHLAQMNVATARYPLTDSRMRDFVVRLDGINGLAERSPGFVWRLKDESGNATDIQFTDDPNLIVNMSVWESPEVLFEFVYRTAHTRVMARRREWFERPTEAFQVLWWVPAGREPTVEEGFARLSHLRAHGPTAEAFTFKERFPSPAGEDADGQELAPEPYCVGWS